MRQIGPKLAVVVLCNVARFAWSINISWPSLTIWGHECQTIIHLTQHLLFLILHYWFNVLICTDLDKLLKNDSSIHLT